MTNKTQTAVLTQSSALALATGLMVTASPAAAQFADRSFEAEGIVVEGQAIIIEDFDSTEIIVESEGVVIDWLPFDDQGPGDILFQNFGTTATFRDDGIITNFAVLNRILPTDLSRRVVFDGTVISEIQGQVGGTVFFYSPGGILVGSNAVFDVGNLGLTTAEPVTDGFGNFILGDRVDFLQSDPNAAITIDPGAQIFADRNNGSYVALFAPQIINRGDITVDGQAALVAGEAGSITFSPDGLFDIQVDVGTDFGTGIENSGFIGGPASADGSSRVYMVAISKNNATTIAIRGNSSLGFDVASSAFMDGDTVVLSAGFNITVGEIDSVEASDGFLNILTEDAGLGSGTIFTSSVVGRAASDVTLVAGDILNFDGNATFSGRQTITTVEFDSGAGTTGNLLVGGDLSLIADRSRDGLDVGVSEFRVFEGSADIAGSLRVESIGAGDGDGNGQVSAGNASVLVDGAASVLNVGADLIAQSSVDLTGNMEGLEANSGFTQVAVANGASVSVGGVTRVKSNSVAGSGGDASANAAALIAVNGGQLSTGELNVTSRAVAGEDTGFGGRNAISAGASISVEGAGSTLDVQFGNITGDGAQGELDFLSSEAIASDGLTDGGGSATSGFIELVVRNAGVVNLPDSRAGSLSIVNRAIGGDTFADDARGGDSDAGAVLLDVNDSPQNLGFISIVSESFAGSGASGTLRTNGGNANQGSVDLQFNNALANLEIGEIRLEARGGNGSEIEGGFAGFAFSGGVNINAQLSQVDINSALNIVSTATGGSAAEFAGSATSGQINVNANNATIAVVEDFVIDSTATGGASLGDRAFIDNFAFSEQGGSASTGSVFFGLNDAVLDVGGALRLMTTAVGGDAVVNQAGSANAGEAFVSLRGDTAGSTINAAAILLGSVAISGNIVDPTSTDGFGNGGQASSGRTLISFDGGDNTIDADVFLLQESVAGNAGQLQGNGGNATLGSATLGANQGGSATITGNWTSEVFARGGNSVVDRGGQANASANEIFNHSGDVTIGGDASFLTEVVGGNGTFGGDANGALVRINTNLGSTTQIGGTLAFDALATGGDGTFGNAGNAFSSELSLDIGASSAIDIGNALQFNSNANGGNAADNRGGDAFGGQVRINANGAGASFILQGSDPQSSSFISTRSTGGESGGADGGVGQASLIELSAFSGATLDLPNNPGNPFAITQLAIGGDTSEDDGMGGAGNGNTVAINIFNSTANLGNLSIATQTVGGSFLAGAERTAGGDANLANVNISLSDADVDAAFAGIVIEGVGGTGTGDVGGVGGVAQSGSFNLSVNNSTFDVLSDLVVQGVTQGGDGSVGGEAAAVSLNTSLSDSSVNISGNLDLNSQSFGGTGLAVNGTGGIANVQTVRVDLADSTLTTSRNVNLTGSATGGNALEGDGGSATVTTVETTLSGGSTLNASALNFQASSVGGSALGSGTSLGGDATIISPQANYSFDGSSDIATLNASINIATSAIGGNAALNGGDGGNAIAGSPNISNFVSGTLDVNGSVSFDATAIGGEAPQGVGGTANGGGADVIAFNGSSVLIDGGVSVASLARGGDGLTGGDVNGAGYSIIARGTVEVGGAFTVNEQVFGGLAFESETPGTGGNAQGGGIQISAFNDETLPVSSVTVGSIDVTSNVVGGEGSSGINGADGGTGGMAFGTGGTIIGRAINAPLVVNGATTITTTTTGGRGGTGTNGGDGGDASFGNFTIGTASGGSVPDVVGGSATFTTIDLVSEVVGGLGGGANGGAGSGTGGGTGGDGGQGIGGGATLLVRGAPVTADSVNFTLNGTGGDGGFGAVQGNGGDGVGGNGSLLITEAFENPGTGAADIGSFVLNSAGQGGAGTVAGDSEFATRSQLIVEQSNVTLGSFTANIEGETRPDYLVEDEMTGQVPVTVLPFSVNITDGATLDVGTLTINTTSDIELFSNDATVFSDVFEINAAEFIPVAPDTAASVASPSTPGLISASSSLVLTTDRGDIIADTNLASSSDLILNSPGGIITGDLRGASVSLTLGAGGVLDTGAITAPGGLVSIEALDSLSAPGVIDADALLLRSINGDVNFEEPLTLAGSLTAEAAGSINAGELSAGTIALTAIAGDIVASGPINAGEFVDLDAGGGIDLGEVNATSILANSETGGFAAETLTATDSIGIEADGSINVTDITTGSLTAVAGSDLVVGGSIGASGAVDLQATMGGLSLGDVNGGSIALRSLANDVVVQGGLTSMGAVVVDAGGQVALGSVFAGSLDALAQGGDITASAALSTDGATNLTASGAVSLAQLTAGSFDIDAQMGDITASGALSAGSDAVLGASGSIRVGEVTAGSILAEAQAGTITAGALNAPGGLVDVSALGAIEVASIDALAIALRSSGGTFTSTGAVSAEEDADIEAAGDVSLQMVSARSLGLRSLMGSVSAGGDIAVDDAANIAANGDANLDQISAGTLDLASAQGVVELGGPVSVGGNANITGLGSVSLTDIAAGSLNAASQAGDVTISGTATVVSGANLEAASGSVSLNNVTASAINTRSGALTTIGGTLQAPVVDIVAASLGTTADTRIDAGANGSVSIGSTNANGVLVGADVDTAISGFVIGTNLLASITAGNLAISSLGEAASIEIGDLDITAIEGLSNLSFTAGNTIDIVGALTSTGSLALSANRVTLNTDTGRIDLGTDANTLSVNAGSFIAGDSGVIEGFSADLSAQEAQDLINTPATTPVEGGVITAGALVLNVSEAAVIQNTGTEDVPAGFVIGSAEGLAINAPEESGALVILNGQVAGTDGGNLTGDDAATSILTAFEESPLIGGSISAGSQINSCAFTGCTAITTETGEITSTVSASVSGATAAATSSASGDTGSASGSTSDAGSDGGADGGDASSSEDASGEEADSSGAPSSATASGAGSAGGGEITTENVDDGGGGPGEFDIEPSDSDAGSDSGSDSGGDTDSGSDAEGGSDEGDSASDEGDTSDEGEASDEGDSEESDGEESDGEESDAEESEESEEDTEDEDESEDEDSSEEEEESEGPTTGPINAPPSIINTNGLEQRGTINDPISGSGNPALLDPQVTTSPLTGTGGQ